MTDLLRIPFERPFLATLAAELLQREGDGLPRTLVLLPSSRAARSLNHALLEASGCEALVLPVVTTPGGWVRELAERLGIDREPFPAALRAEWLARTLADLEWLAHTKESAPGLAAEFVALFDDMRRHGLDPADPAAAGGADDLLMSDVDHVRDAWRCYRPLIPWDDVDAEISVTSAVESAPHWPGRPFDSLWIAGFVDMSPLRARLLRAAAGYATRTVVALSDAATDGFAAAFLGTFRDETSPLHPGTPGRAVVADLGLATDPIAPLCDPSRRKASLQLLPCPDSEQESRRIAAVVVERLQRTPTASIAVATNDQRLARRIAAQLRDAGLDLDDSGGVPLSSTPPGRLLWLLMRCVITGPAHEPLLELLTHPLTTFGHDRGRLSRRVLSFEKNLLRGETAPGNLAGYRARAQERDAELMTAVPGAKPEMTELVDDLERSLEPLLDVVRGEHAVDVLLDALKTSWRRAAPETPLPAIDDSSADAAPLAVARLLEALATVSTSAPSMTLHDVAALLGRLLGAETVRPHRPLNLPVQITGLLEARLETYDLLVLGGLTEDGFPGRVGRPLHLGRAWRESAGLPDWRRTMGQQAELFARLLHAADDVVATWPGEVDGQPVLPSPFLQRLLLAGLRDEPLARPAPLYRRAPDQDHAPLPLPQKLDDEAPAVLATTRPVHAVSPSALAVYRACPYRWLLDRGFGLAEEDDVKEALAKRDQGTIVHDCLARLLAPGGPAVTALAAGRLDEAHRLLTDIAADRFAFHAGNLPQRRLWEASFLAGADALLQFEHRRLQDWRPVAVEAPFDVPLGALADWLGRDLELTDHERSIPLHGRIDRIDAVRDGSSRCAVLDYKSGASPSARDVAEGRDLQLSAYALAVILGSLPDLPDAPVVAGGAFYALGGDEPGFKTLLALDQLERDAELIVTTARAMIRAEGAFPLVPDEIGLKDPAPCRFCHLRGVCRIDERDLAHRAEGVEP